MPRNFDERKKNGHLQQQEDHPLDLETHGHSLAPPAFQLLASVGGDAEAMSDATQDAPVQRVMLGASKDINTQNPMHVTKVEREIDAMNVQWLQWLKPQLDSKHVLEKMYIARINERMAVAGALDHISSESQQALLPSIYTSATIMLDGQAVGYTQPEYEATSQTQYYSQLAPEQSNPKHDEDHNSRNDSEVATLEMAYFQILGLKQHITDSSKLKIIISGTSGPCDGCKDRILAFQKDVYALLPDGATLEIESAYLNRSAAKNRNGTDTRYGWADAEPRQSASGQGYYSKAYPKMTKEEKKEDSKDDSMSSASSAKAKAKQAQLNRDEEDDF